MLEHVIRGGALGMAHLVHNPANLRQLPMKMLPLKSFCKYRWCTKFLRMQASFKAVSFPTGENRQFDRISSILLL